MLKDAEKADKLKQSLPPGMLTVLAAVKSGGMMSEMESVGNEWLMRLVYDRSHND